MRHRVICHMLSSVDGRIDGSVLQAVIDEREYETTGTKLNGNAWICGRTTMQQHFADNEPFVSASKAQTGPRPVHVARSAESYAISVDTVGKLRWSQSDVGADHLICVVSEQAPEDYLPLLREQGISYVVAGATSVDLVRAVDLLGEHFGILTDIPTVFDGVNSRTLGAVPLRLKSLEQPPNDVLWLRYEVVRS